MNSMTLSFEAMILIAAVLIGMAGYAAAFIKSRQQELKPVRVKAQRKHR